MRPRLRSSAPVAFAVAILAVPSRGFAGPGFGTVCDEDGLPRHRPARRGKRKRNGLPALHDGMPEVHDAVCETAGGRRHCAWDGGFLLPHAACSGRQRVQNDSKRAPAKRW